MVPASHPRIPTQTTRRTQHRVRRFLLIRDHDVSGISGTGTVAEGCVFTDGTTILRWRVTRVPPAPVVRPTTVVHESPDSVVTLHGHGGATHIEWLD